MKYSSLLVLALMWACAPQSETDTQSATESAPEIYAEAIDYSADGVTLKGFLAYDKNKEGERPGVLVVHEWWGHNDYARKRAKMLAEMGYTALAVDMYGDGKQADHPDDAGKFAGEVIQNIEIGEKRFNAALELLRSQPTTDASRIAAIGYCFGGAVVLHAARIGTDLKGVVSFHGDLSSLHTPEAGSIKARILVCHGAADPFVPAEAIEAFKKEMDKAGADYQFVAYEGAKHSFTNPEADANGEKFNLPLAYNAEADAESWEAMQAMFAEVFARQE